MNCQDFNNIIDELADYKPIPDALREMSVSHAALCPTCAANLAEARAVSSYLLQAARAESEAAPARVKANLLSAFEQSALVERPESNVQSRKQNTLTDFRPSTFDFRRKASVVDIGSRRGSRRWFAAAAALAAVVLLAAIFPILRRTGSPVSPPATPDLNAVSTGATLPVSDLPNRRDFV